MKKIINLLVLILLQFILFSCQNSVNSDTDNTTESEIAFSEGWYKHTTTADGTSASYYLYYDSTKTLLRAGSETREFTGTIFEKYKNSDGFAWEALNRSKSNNITFEKINKSDLPDWGKETSTEEDSDEDKTYFTKLSKLLTDFTIGRALDYENDTISFSNIDSTIQLDEKGKKYITCTFSYSNKSKTVKSIFSNIFSDDTSGTITNARLYLLQYVKFFEVYIAINNTSPFNDENGPDYHQGRILFRTEDFSTPSTLSIDFYPPTSNIGDRISYTKIN